MSKNPVATNVLVGIVDMGMGLNKIAEKLMKNSPLDRISDETMAELKTVIQDGIKAVTNTDEVDKQALFKKMTEKILGDN